MRAVWNGLDKAKAKQVANQVKYSRKLNKHARTYHDINIIKRFLQMKRWIEIAINQLGIGTM